MKGQLKKIGESWRVRYSKTMKQCPECEEYTVYEDLYLHPEEAKICNQYGDYSMDWINKEVEFEIVEERREVDGRTIIELYANTGKDGN